MKTKKIWEYILIILEGLDFDNIIIKEVFNKQK